MSDHVAVVGAGLAGLAAALHLSERGVDVRLYDAADRVGGQVATDAVDGFLIDRGFQVHNTAYPEPAKLLDEDALRFGAFVRGALLCTDDGSHLVADLRSAPLAAPALLTAPLGSLRDRLALGRLTTEMLLQSPARLKSHAETTTYDYLVSKGLSDSAIDNFLRPFLGGVFLETELVTSSRLFLMVFRSIIHGRSVLPAEGIGAIPAQLAARLPAGTVQLGQRLEALPADAAAVIVATDATTAYALLPELGTPPPLSAVTTIYHASRAQPTGQATIRLDASDRPLVQNTVVLSAAAPSYAPPGRHLISTSVLGADVPESVVRQALPRFYGPAAAEFEHLTTVSVPRATPTQPPPLGSMRKPVRVRPGVYVAGAHRDTASTQGALVSGRRAAAAVLADLHLDSDGDRG